MERPRLVVAALRGGSGKTILSVGIIAAWRKLDKNIAPFKKENEFAGMVCTIRDITERRKVEEELKKSERLKTEFMNIAAHELRSPVTPIKGYLDLIINDKDAKYFAFYHDKWGTVDAEPLLDINGNEVKGDVDGQSSVSYEIVPPANVVVAAMGLETAQYTNLYTPIDKDTTVHMIAAKETLYADPMDPPSSLDKIEKKMEELDEKIIDIFGNIW